MDSPSLLALWFDGSSRLQDWPRVRAEEESRFRGRDQRVRDIPWLNESALVLPSIDIPLARFLEEWGEYLPVETSDRTLWVYNCTNTLKKALSVAAADLHRPNLEFNEDVLKDQHVFRVEEDPAVVFFDQVAVDAVRDSGLSGPVFEPTHGS